MLQEINFKNLEKNFEKEQHRQHIEKLFEENLENEYLNVKNIKPVLIEEPDYSDDSDSSYTSDSDSSDSDSSDSESSDSESSDSDSSDSESNPNETDSHDSYQFQGLGY